MLTTVAIVAVAIAVSPRLAQLIAREVKALLDAARSSPKLGPRERAELAARLWVTLS